MTEPAGDHDLPETIPARPAAAPDHAGAGTQEGSGGLAEAATATDGEVLRQLRAWLREGQAIVDGLDRRRRRGSRRLPGGGAAQAADQFMKVCTTAEAGWVIRAGPLYELYLAWCEQAHIAERATLTAFGLALAGLHYGKILRQRVLYTHIRLSPAGRNLGAASGIGMSDFYLGEAALEGSPSR